MWPEVVAAGPAGPALIAIMIAAVAAGSADRPAHHP
jgi:hypothetical protein